MSGKLCADMGHFIKQKVWLYLLLTVCTTPWLKTLELVSAEKFKCVTVGKFLDSNDPHRYHQCFFLFGTLTYIHNICPFQTCFSPTLNYCVATACKQILVTTDLKETLGTAYTCKDKKFTCRKKGVFAHEKDPSVYFKCSKIWGRWTSICYTCNSKHRTVFNNEIQACIPRPARGDSDSTEIAITDQWGSSEEGDGTDSSKKKPKTTTYDCEGYDFFPCYKLGIGLHGFPGDLSVYMQCTKNSEGEMEGKCHVCPTRGNTCFVEVVNQCIERCGKGSPHQPYNCSTYTVEDVECETEGLVAHAIDTSVFFNCVRNLTNWEIQCFTCSNGKTKTCFSELQQACVTYTGTATAGTGTDHKCPPITVIDGPEDAVDVGTPDTSLTWDCAGYNEGSFPCDKFGEEEEFETPADKSVYFQCVKRDSKWVAECEACPSETWSCYDPDEQVCREDCVPRVHVPYDCRTYNDHSYPCTEPGFFSNVNDTSIYHKCVFPPEGGHKTMCYACSNGDKKTCFDNDEQACVTIGDNTGSPCGSVEMLGGNLNKGTKESSLTYSKDGYSETSFPCKELGQGEFAKPGDASVYVTCGNDGETEFAACPKETNSFYVSEQKSCVENFGLGIPTTTARPVPSYSCSGVKFECEEEGTFAYPSDTSIYFRCIAKENGFHSICFACSSLEGTCYSEEKNACIKTELPCGEESHLNHNGKPHLSYDCEGYSENSFSCGVLGPGFFGIPGDPSVFLECFLTADNELSGKCHACLGNSCYDSKKKVCVKNCGKGELHKPYNCSTYGDTSYPCTRAGYFANSFQTSIYFQCVFVEGSWKSYCYSCSANKTCFNDKKQACVLNNGNTCGNTTVPQDGGTKKDSLTFSCEGYNNLSFPCSKMEPGTYVMPGDNSIYWTCREDGTGECHACSEEKKAVYNPIEKQCVENYGKGPPPLAYNCSSYHSNSFKCKTEGAFANPKDSSVYFKCTKRNVNETDWNFECFTCNSRNQTCFDDITKACVDGGGRPCGGKTIEVHQVTTGEGQPILVAKNASRIHSCVGYEGYIFNCKEPGNFTVPGDKSIYYTCYYEGSRLLALCKSCPRQHKGCFIKEVNKCVDNCGKGAEVDGTVRQYDCSGYHLKSFPCQQQGLFAHPRDPTVFFHCLKSSTGNWESRCYSCNSLSKSTFSTKKQRCVIGGVSDESPALDYEGVSLVYGDNCRGYGASAIPCGALTAKQSLTQIGFKTYFEHKGDPAVYFLCIQVGQSYQAFCHMCPLSSCFDQATQNCIAPCSEYVPTDTSDPVDVGPPWPYDCRFYTDDSFPCTETGLYSNPIDTSIYFHCVKENSMYKAVCYTCNSKLRTCFSENKQTCVFSEDQKCGKMYNTNGTVIGKTYDCTGYEPLPSLPCSQVGVGTWPIYGDTSVYFTCEGSKETGYTGQCFTCSKENAACFDPKKGDCIDHCILLPYKPYSCEIYDHYSFNCLQEGFFSQTFDSSVFFQCVREGKHFKALCHTCNSHLRTCFSNKIQACLTKGGQPCGEGDPFDAVVGGTEEGSIHHTCQGYNDLSFPCDYHLGGTFGTRADPSVFFNCVKIGEKWVAECNTCSKEEDACFDDQRKVCVENCGKGAHTPYRCDSYDSKAMTCTKEGLFRNPKDPSIFFKCVRSSGAWGWKTYCFSCNQEKGTCYDEATSACLTFAGKSCAQITDSSSNTKPPPAKGSVEDSRSYDCTGYNELSIPCSLYGPGKHVMPADKSVYFECVVRGGELVAQCHSCDASRRACFVDKEQKCVENCGLGPHKPWDCSTRRFKCMSEGLFADPDANSVFYKCQRKPDGKLESQCFTCNNGAQKTCFSDKKQACVLANDAGRCGKIDPADIDSSVSLDKSRTYDCPGYNKLSFPCSKYPPGIYPTPAENSVYFECKSSSEAAECRSCNQETDSIFDPVEKKCIQNFGKGPHQPYSCVTYHDKSFKCKDAGLFANPVDSSVFFKCVKKGDDWESWCFVCNSKKQTCFSESQKSCVTRNNQPCGGGDPFLKDNKAGTPEISRAYECSGYFRDNKPFPCAKHSPGLYGHPGDLSIYFTCQKKSNQYVAICSSCDKNTLATFDNAKGAKKCVEGKVEPYNCASFHDKSYPCKEAGLFANPRDSSTFFKCVKKGDIWESHCYTCSSSKLKKTCFSNNQQSCISTTGKSCGKGDPVMGKDNKGVTPEKSRAYECSGYNHLSFPCAKHKFGLHGHPADLSIYFTCQKRKNAAVAICSSCNSKTQATYDSGSKKCLDYGGKEIKKPASPQPASVGKPKPPSPPAVVSIKAEPYDCSTTNSRSYPCEREGGYWANPQHTSLYHKCIRNGNKLDAICFSCNRVKKTCFSDELQACITIGSATDCGSQDPINLHGHGNRKNSWTYDDTGYKYKPPSFPCSSIGDGFHGFPGDLSVFVLCSKKDGKWEEMFIVCGDTHQGGFFNKDTVQCEPEYRWSIVTGEPPSPPSNFQAPGQPKSQKKYVYRPDPPPKKTNRPKSPRYKQIGKRFGPFIPG